MKKKGDNFDVFLMFDVCYLSLSLGIGIVYFQLGCVVTKSGFYECILGTSG